MAIKNIPKYKILLTCLVDMNEMNDTADNIMTGATSIGRASAK